MMHAKRAKYSIFDTTIRLKKEHTTDRFLDLLNYAERQIYLIRLFHGYVYVCVCVWLKWPL